MVVVAIGRRAQKSVTISPEDSEALIKNNLRYGYRQVQPSESVHGGLNTVD